MRLLKDNITGLTADVKTTVTFSLNDDVLTYNIIAFQSSLNSYSDSNNDELYRGDTVEVFLDLGDDDFYYEFEVAPNGATFVAKKYKDHLEFIDSSFFHATSTIKDDTYTVTITIDISKLKPIKYLKHNVYRIETKKIKENYMLMALNPTCSDTFHVRSKFIDFDSN